jgi:hypothetical protein
VAAFSAGQTLTAANLIAILPIPVIKGADESVTNAGTGTTLQNDNELLAAVTANTNYKIDLVLLVVEAAGTGIDIKVAWTQPAGCVLDLGPVAPHASWVSAAALEVEWAAWQAETGTTTASKSFGSTNSATFAYHFRGTLRVGSTAGTFQLQWAQVNGSASALTVKAGSSLILTPLLT